MKKRSLISVCAMVVLTIALSVSALAASSVQDQMAANSAAWWLLTMPEIRQPATPFIRQTLTLPIVQLPEAVLHRTIPLQAHGP
jgi:hypothetical protein